MKKNKLVPRLRFQEFKNSPSWDIKKLEQLLSIGNGRDYKHLSKGNIPVYGSGGYMCSVDDFLYDGESVCIGRKGTINRPIFINGKFWTVDTLFYTYSYINCIPKFIYNVFQKIDWLKYNEAGGLPSLSKTTIQKIPIYIPTIEEQKKIADCLASIDDLIEAEKRKLEVLKKYKKALMQKLFPAEDASIPKLRFPEFSADIDFLNGNLLFEQISNKNHNSDLPILAITQDKGAIPRNEIDYNIIATEKSISTYKVVEIGDFIISLRSFQGGIEYSSYKGICSPAYIILRKKNNNIYEPYYKYYFKTDRYIINLNANIEGIRDGKMISYSQFSDIKIPYTTFEEQQKISDCLASIDSIIDSQVKRIDNLIKHKKALMQGLFPDMESIEDYE